MVTSQKCKESRTLATYSIHHFWKQDLSAKYFPSFADDLNVHENPNVSKFSTFNIIADNFFFLGNNFLKLSSSERLFLNLPIPITTSVNKPLPQNFTVSSSKIKYCLASSTGVQDKTLVSNSTSFSDIILILHVI